MTDQDAKAIEDVAKALETFGDWYDDWLDDHAPLDVQHRLGMFVTKLQQLGWTPPEEVESDLLTALADCDYVTNIPEDRKAIAELAQRTLRAAGWAAAAEVEALRDVAIGLIHLCHGQQREPGWTLEDELAVRRNDLSPPERKRYPNER